VFVRTNDPSGNSIVAFRRNSDGTLTLATSYRTGGNGGRTSGSASDPLSSRGSLVLGPAAPRDGHSATRQNATGDPGQETRTSKPAETTRSRSHARLPGTIT
jgi:hypothetical protein